MMRPDGAIRVLRRGAGPPLVLQHGFLGGSGYWEPVTNRLAAHFDVIACDLPGFGASHDLPVPGSVAGFAGVMLDRLDRLGVGRFSLIGHSLGGMIALQAALDRPDRIDRLVLYGTAADASAKGRFETLEETIARFRSEGLEATAGRIVASWFVEGRRSPHFAMCRAAGEGCTVDTAVRTLRAAAGWDATARLGGMSRPALVICGDRDRAVPPERSLELWRGLPDAQLCVVPGRAHCVHLEGSDLFATIVLEFLKA